MLHARPSISSSPDDELSLELLLLELELELLLLELELLLLELELLLSPSPSESRNFPRFCTNFGVVFKVSLILTVNTPSPMTVKKLMANRRCSGSSTGNIPCSFSASEGVSRICCILAIP